MSKAKKVPERFAVMGVDPGGVTGLARGVFTGGWDTIADTLKAHAEGVEAWTCAGSVEEQAHEIAAEFRDWATEVHLFNLVGVNDIYLVVEDFQLRQRSVDLVGVEVAAGIKCLLAEGVESAEGWGGGYGLATLSRQSASDAKGFATNARLRDWGLYKVTVGKGDHKRDAVRHVALKVAGIVG